MPRQTPGDVPPSDVSGGPVERPLSPEVAAYWLAAVVDSADDAVITKTLDGVITSWNPGARRLFGYEADEVIGKPVTILFPADHINEEPAILSRIRAGERVEHYETVRRRKDGSLVEISLTVSPIRKPDGTIIGASKIARDITGRRHEERDRRFVLELGEKIRLGGSKPEELLDDVARAIGEHLGAARCLFVEIDEAENRGTVKHEYRRDGIPPVPREYKISDYSPETLEEIRTGRAIVNHDAEHDPRTAARFATVYEPYGERSYVSVPLFTDGRWRAIFWVSDDHARRWAPQEISFLEGVAERAWLAAEKLRNEVGLRESEERLRAIVGQATAGITQNDRSGRFVFVNDRYCEIVGYTREELLRMRMQEITDPEVLPANVELFERVWRDGTPFVIEKQYVRKDGSRVWVNNNVAPVVGAGGKTESVVCVTIDVTERVTAEERLKRAQAEADRQRRLYDTILSSTPDLIYTFDLDHRFTYANEVLLRMWGRSWDEAVGKNCLELGYPDWHAEMHDRELEQVKSTKRPVRGVVPFEGAFGRRLYDYIFVPIIGADGEVEAVAGATRDVTELKEAEENLRQSREMLSLAMSGSRMGAWSRNLLTDGVYWSPELEAIFGLPAGSFSGRIDDYYDLVHPEDRERLRREVREAIDGRRGYVIEFRYRHADGGLRWMEGRGQAVYSAEGEPAQVFGIGLDVTERKRAALNSEFLAAVGDDFARVSSPEEVVRAVGERLNRFLNISTCAFVEVNETADAVAINYEWHREGVPSLAGLYRLPEFVTPEFMRAAKSGETIVIRDVKTDSRIADPGPWSALKIGAHVNVPLVRSGEWRFSLCVYHAEAYDWRDDEISLMRELASRVWTRLERAFAEKEREGLLEREHEARLRAEEASRLKDEFLATVSHELRTPLKAILGWAHMLRSGQLGAEGAARAIETIERNARSQAQLVEDLLDVSRIITGKLRIDVRPVDPNSVIEAAVDAVRPAAEAKGVRLQKVIDTGLASISGDPVRLQQVAWNLLSNAIKFTPRGGRVQVRLERVNSHVELDGERHRRGHRPPSSCRTSSTASGRPTRRRRATTAGSASGSRSSATSSSCTAGACARRARARGRARPSPCCSPSRPSTRRQRSKDESNRRPRRSRPTPSALSGSTACACSS